MTDTYTEDTYTEAQIREAINTAAHSVTEKDVWVVPDLVIAELTKPAYVPKVGEVAFRTDSRLFDKINTQGYAREFRFNPLTQTECGPVGEALGVAIDAMESAQRYTAGSDCAANISNALTEIKRLTGDV